MFDNASHLIAINALMGNFEQADQDLEELQNRLRVLGQPIFGLWPDELGLLWIRKGEWNLAEAQLSEAYEWAVRGGNRVMEAGTAQKLGELYLSSGQYDAAQRYLFRALDLFTESVSRVSELALLPHLCELHLRMDNLVASTESLNRAKEIAPESTDWGAISGDIWVAEGMVYFASGQESDAEAILSKAIDLYREYSLPWDEARAYYEWAVGIMCEGQGKARARRAGDFLRKAILLWEPMVASGHAERCRAMLLAIE